MRLFPQEQNEEKTMTVLYRRFLLVTALIAAFAGVTANVIQQTRSERAHIHIWKSIPVAQNICVPEKICAAQSVVINNYA